MDDEDKDIPEQDSDLILNEASEELEEEGVLEEDILKEKETSKKDVKIIKKRYEIPGFPKEDNAIAAVVNKIMNCTVLFDLEEEDWNEMVVMKITKFVITPNIRLLTLYFEEDILTASFEFPTCRTTDIQYFSRLRKDIVLKLDNFNDSIIFGTLDQYPERNAVMLLGKIYAPLICGTRNWPAGPKMSLVQCLHSVLSQLTQFQYDSMGLSGLYVPCEGSNIDIKSALKDDYLVARLDRIVLNWYTYLTKSISDNAPQFLASEGLVPMDAYYSALNKYENAIGILEQLQSKPIVHICNILLAARSPYIQKFLSLSQQVLEVKEKALSNAEYLSILEGPCKNLDSVSHPSEIAILIPDILKCFRFIWVNSPYFNNNKCLEMLCSSLSNHIVLKLKTLTNIKATFNLKPKSIIPCLEKNIACCENYKEIYKKAVSLHNKYNRKKPWNLEEHLIFFKTDTFSQRCKDVLEISHSLIIFGRVDETKESRTELQFYWSKNEQLQKILAKIENTFWGLFNNIKVHQDRSIDESANIWISEIKTFREGIEQLEFNIENALQFAMVGVENIEEGIDILQMFYDYTKRPKLMPSYTACCREIYNLFKKDIIQYRKEMVAERQNVHLYMPRYSGRSMILYLKERRLEHLHKLIKNSYWVKCGKDDKIENDFLRLKESISQARRKLLNKWVKLVGDVVVEKRLKRSLLKKTKSGLIYSNIDRKALNIAREAEFFSHCMMGIHSVGSQLLDFRGDILQLHNYLVLIAADYNYVITKLSGAEKLLFQEIIFKMDQIIADGLSKKYDWSSQRSIPYLIECFVYIREFRDFTEDYKRANERIYAICKLISIINIYDIPEKETFTLKQLEDHLSETKLAKINLIVDYYNEIFDILLFVYDGFASSMKQMKLQWIKYITRIDKLIQEAFRLCAKKSMKSALKAFRISEGQFACYSKNIFIKCQANIKGHEVIYDPMFMELVSLAKNFLPDLIIELSFIPRLFEKFNIKLPKKKIPYVSVIAIDEECRQLQTNIEKEISICYKAVKAYEQIWEPFKCIWEVDRNKFIEKLIEAAPDAEVYRKEISKYMSYALNVKSYPKNKTIHILRMNFSEFIQKIIKHCAVWHRRISYSLMRATAEEIEAIYEFSFINMKRLLTYPKTLKQVPIAEAYRTRLDVITRSIEETFPEIDRKMELLHTLRDDIPKIMIHRYKEINEQWDKLEKANVKSAKIIEKATIIFKEQLNTDYEHFIEEIGELLKKFADQAPTSPSISSDGALPWLADFKAVVNKTFEKDEEFKINLALVKAPYRRKTELMNLNNNLDQLLSVWQVTHEWDRAWDTYRNSKFWAIKPEEMEITAQELWKKLSNMFRELRDKNWPIVEHSKKRVEAFKKVLPLINDLKNKAMKQRHWDQVKAEMKTDFDEKSDAFTLDLIIAIKMQDYADIIHEISNAATMELNIENTLIKIKDQWSDLNLQLVPHKDKGMFKLVGVDDIFQVLEDHQTAISAMKSTRYVQPFLNEANYWEKNLIHVLDVLEASLNVQRLYLYLENIFTGEDIRRQLPKETNDFDRTAASWRSVTANMQTDKNAFKATHYPGLLKMLNGMITKLEEIQKSLEQYLETKRNLFPRFYFISNDDLLEIIGNSKKPELIQPHFKKCFDNIHKVNMIVHPHYNRTEGVGMYSGDGEYIPWGKNIILEGPVEQWLTLVEKIMRVCLRDNLRNVKNSLKKFSMQRDKWLSQNPGQLCITASQIQWTYDCTKTLLQCRALVSKTPLKKLKKKQNQCLGKYSDAIRGDLQKLERLKVVAIVTIEIHARDVIETMYKQSCTDVTAFEWQSQLRFYWESSLDDCVVKQTNTRFMYGYEYLGNSGRLVITPLTDRCYITLTTALHLYRGGSPKGPAGTGKTETVKDLGKALAYYVIVINCSEGLDYRSMGRMFSGFSQTGAWGCFDEFNRINIEVLSVVAQQILSILSALSQKLDEFVFEGSVIKLISTCGIFITMNPGYAGRTELPDNLKSMFRPISMMVPDSMLIAEITLFGEGFLDTRVLAKKVFTLFSLAKQQLSKQDHYDFGLRGMVALLRYAGKKRRQLVSQLNNEEVVLLAMKDMNIAKLTADDLPLFLGITRDLFPTVTVPAIDYETIFSVLRVEFKKVNLQEIQAGFTKVIQLYETKGSRHSVMLVGATGSAKSTTWKMLKATLTSLHEMGTPGFVPAQEYLINPKAVNLGELYGEYNLATGEWADGILSVIMRKTCADESKSEKWILFDGPVDAVWIENMNSVMDDNKVLTLINSERITMPEQVSLLFEVGDLAVASPATVSRCGIVFNDYKEFGWRPFFNSWITQFDEEEYKKEMTELFDKYVDNILTFKRLNCEETIPVPEICSVISLCRLLQILGRPQDLAKIYPPDTPDYSYAARLYFFFCVLWSLAASLSERGRLRMDKYLREIESSFPILESVYEYYINPKFRAYRHWQEKLPENWKYNPEIPFCKIFVPSVDSLRYSYLTQQLLSNQCPVLLTGSVGTGKTSCAISVLDNLDPSRFSLLAINMSAQTTSNNIQDTIMSRLEKRTKGIYYPAGGKTMITFMDDFNMPAKEVYGAQPPLELIRQWIDYGFWYNRQDQTIIKVKDMLLMSAMGPPGGGRNMITDRLLSRFSVISVTFPSDSQIRRIFSSMLSQHLSSFPEEIQKLSDGITLSTLNLFNSIVSKLLPTPAKMHYLFNLRDISRIFQGLLRANTDYMPEKPHLLRLWAHEAFRVFNDRLIDERDSKWFSDKFAEILADNFGMSLGGLFQGLEPPTFCDFLNQYNLYAEAKDDILKTTLVRQMNEYNSSSGVVRVDLVLFKEAMQHICRIARVISQPRGHILLVGLGGSGRQSLSRLAAYICQFDTFQIELTRNYRVGEFKEDLKRVYFTTGVKDTPLSFLFCDNQVAEEAFLEIMNNILSTGEVTNLYKIDEFEEIKTTLFEVVKRAGFIPTNESIYSFLIDRVRTNLHIILCMSPVGDEFRTRLRQYPSIINCTTIDWFHDWPKQALLEVANNFMQQVDMTATITGEPYVEKPEDAGVPRQGKLRRAVASVCAVIHDSVAKMSNLMREEMKRHNYVTPSNFLELVATYKENLQSKREEAASQANKLRNGLSKLIETRETVEGLALELEAATVQVGLKNEECEKFLEALQKQQVEVDEQHKAVAAKSAVIEEEERECQQLADIALADLKEAMPALEAAMKALEALNKKDLTEIKSYGRPPQKVEMVMEAVMVLLQVETSWAEAKRQLGDVNFLNHLKDFDKDHIPDKVLRRIGTYVRNPEFEPDKVGIVSTAAKSLAMWVIAIEKYGKIYRIVAPKKAKVDEAMASLKQKQNALAEARAHLNKLMKVIEDLRKAYNEKLNEKEQLRIKAEELQNKLDRSRKLVENLMGERSRWESTVSSLDILFDQLPGDCLLGTAFVSYMGPFVSRYRERLIESWKENVDKEEVPNSRSLFNPVDFLAKPTQIRDWNIQGLPSDSFSTENGIIVTRGSRWPLIIDPQAQAWKWIRNMERSSGLKTVDFGVPNFMKIIESAMEVGEPILVQNVVEVLDPSITPILNKAIVHKGQSTFIKLGDRLAPYDTRFKFYITTKLSNPHFPPEISTKTTLVNFAIKEEGLEAQLLGIVVRKERPALEEQKDSLVLNIAAGKKTLIELENELLRLLNESEGPILENVELFNTLDYSRKTAKEVTEQLAVSIITEKEIDAAREGYRVCARRASILFFVLTDMSTIDPMYQFSLDSYIDLFESSIAKYKKSTDLEERMKNLNLYHTYAMYKNTCRGLFEGHKLLFSFHICMKILQSKKFIKHHEYQFLLKGGVVLNRDTQKPKPPFEWITDECWDNLTELDKIPGFIGIAKSIDVNQKDWKEWYLHAAPEEARLVGEWHESCKDFQKMIILRCMRLDRLSFAITTFISKHLGKQFTEPPVLDIKAVLEDSVAKTPLIFVLSPGVDPTGALLQLADTSGMAHRFHSLSLGQGQSPIATKLIADGKTQGFWVFLANCHLSLSWMPALDKIVELLQSDPDIHPEFRLWLSSSPHPDFPLSILQSSLKMTTEPPKGLKANMKRLYNNLTEERISVCKAESKYKRLLFSLCFFHAVLIERKKFQQLGWNVIYSFNDSDFEVSENILAIYLDEYPVTPWDALKYLIAGVCYGGHVTDDWDRRLLLTYINRFFTNDAITKPLFRLSDLYEYYIPEDSDLASYQNFINALPSFDDPQAFGQHANADIMSLINDSKMLCETLLSLQGSESGGAVTNVEEEVMQLSTDILSRVPDLMDYEATERNIGYNKQPLEVVLLQEISRYNVLLNLIRTSLEDLQKGIKGTVVMSSELEDIFICIYEARIPSPWLRAYPSLKKLGSWTRDLVKRIEFFTKWSSYLKPPALFVLGYFTFPTGFLTAVLQTSARRLEISIDLLTWDFTPIAKPENEIVAGAPEGVFISGMFLEGAGWDRKSLRLCEPLPMQLIVPLPVILFKPIVPLKKKPKGLYSCPVYYYPQRSGTQGREAYVVAVELKIVEFTTPDHWIKRGTAILLSLST